MSVVCYILVLIIILLTGFMKLFKNYRNNNNRIDFADEYRSNFIKMANSYNNSPFDNNLYAWLTMNVDKIQTAIGIHGINHYKPPHGQIIENCPIILNTIPKFRTGRIHELDIGIADDCFLRYLGVLEINSEEILKDLKNPFKWFLYGFQLFINIPFISLGYFGVISDSKKETLLNNKIFKSASGIIKIFLTLYALFNMIMDWEKIVNFVRNLI